MIRQWCNQDFSKAYYVKYSSYFPIYLSKMRMHANMQLAHIHIQNGPKISQKLSKMIFRKLKKGVKNGWFNTIYVATCACETFDTWPSIISTPYLRTERLTLQVITTFILSPQAPVYKTLWFTSSTVTYQDEQNQSFGGLLPGCCRVSFLVLPFPTSQHLFLLQERQASRATPKAVLCQHKLYHHNYFNCFSVLCIINCPGFLLWEKKEGNQLWWSTVGSVRCRAVSVDGGCSVLQGVGHGQEGQVPALLDHHHLHLHLHLLHHHLQYKQCLVHTIRCQHLWIVWEICLAIFYICNVWLIWILWTYATI